MQYSDIYQFRNLYEAYKNARKQKRYRTEILDFAYDVDFELLSIQRDLMNKTYKVGEYKFRTVFEPKKRLISILPFRDRVVQHALCKIIFDKFNTHMIYDSYACRPKKGTHKAVRRVSYWMNKPDSHYYLKLDIKSFFASVDLESLKSFLLRFTDDPDIQWLMSVIIDSTPVSGLPIGNLMSQSFANIVLHEVDHYCKNVLGIKKYIRYMDDIIIIGRSKAELWTILDKLTIFIADHLHLRLNDKTFVARCHDGIQFIGYKVYRYYKLIKKQSITRMKNKMRAWMKGKVSDLQYLAALGSWMGHSFDTSSHRIVNQLMLKSLYHLQKRAAA